MSIDKTLAERAKKYGSFEIHARITYDIKRAMQERSGWDRLDDDMKEALDMIAHEIGRIINGDPSYADSWHDIAGYASLIDRRLNDEHYPDQ